MPATKNVFEILTGRKAVVAAFAANVALAAAHVAWILSGGAGPQLWSALRHGTASVSAVPADPPSPTPAAEFASVPADPPSPTPAAEFASVHSDPPSSEPSAAVPPQTPMTPGVAAGAAAPAGPVATAPSRPAASEAYGGASDTSRCYKVHVGSFKRQATAEKEAARLAAHGFEAYTVQADLGASGTWYRVCVGRYADRAAAVATRDAIRLLPDWSFAYVLRGPVGGGGGDAVAAGAMSQPPQRVPAVRSAARSESVTAPSPVRPEPSVSRTIAAVAAAADPATTATPAPVQRYLEFGKAQSRRGRHADAAEAFRRAADMAPEAAEARTLLAAEYLDLGRLVDAEEEILQAEMRRPEDPRHLFNRALLAYKRCDHLEAQLALVRLFGADWEHVQGRLLMGATFEATGDAERALVEYRHAHRLAPKDPQVLYALARGLDLTGRRGEALSVYEEFVTYAVGEAQWAGVLESVQQRVAWLRRS